MNPTDLVDRTTRHPDPDEPVAGGRQGDNTPGQGIQGVAAMDIAELRRVDEAMVNNRTRVHMSLILVFLLLSMPPLPLQE